MQKRLVVLALLAGTIASASQAELNKYDIWEEDYMVQALLGGAKFDHFKFKVDDSTTPESTDMSTLPQLGGAWSTLPLGDRLQCGLETTFLLGYRVDKINYIQAGGSGLRVSLSTSLWTVDFAGGAYANLFLDPNRKVRLYVGGGPLMMYVSYHAEKDLSDDTEDDVAKTAFGLGAYARTGIEFRIYDKGMLGMGVRGTWADLDFSDVGGDTDIHSLGVFATFTAGF